MASVIYCGNFSHPWCTEVHVARDLRALGHEVFQYQEPTRATEEWVGLTEALVDRMEPDLFLFTRTWGLPESATEMWRNLEARGVVTASYHLDLYLGLQREAGIHSDPFWTTGHVFTPDGDPNSAARFAELGINHHWSPPAVVSDECVPGEWQDRYDYDVVFVGSYGYHKEWPWRRELLDHLKDRYGPRFRRFGGDMPEGPTRGQDLNDLYATARVVVGDSLCLPGHTNYWSDRPYETVGRGGFLLMPRVPGLERHFVDGEHLRFYEYGDLDGLDRLIDTTLDNEWEREAVKREGQAHVAACHTYKKRLKVAMDTMGLGS